MAGEQPPLFSTPLYLLVPVYETVKGVEKKSYPEPDAGMLIYASFRTFGGTETMENDIYSVVDTANVETWYRPDIASGCRIMRAVDGAVYEIIGEPENIGMRGQFLKCRVRRVKGGA